MPEADVMYLVVRTRRVWERYIVLRSERTTIAVCPTAEAAGRHAAQLAEVFFASCRKNVLAMYGIGDGRMPTRDGLISRPMTDAEVIEAAEKWAESETAMGAPYVVEPVSLVVA